MPGASKSRADDADTARAEITDEAIHGEVRMQLDHVIRLAVRDGCGRVASVLKTLRENFYAD
jgi:hypothetical protein